VFYVFFQVQSECLCDFSRVSWAVPVLRGVCAVARAGRVALGAAVSPEDFFHFYIPIIRKATRQREE
jgi:hypothetical protein